MVVLVQHVVLSGSWFGRVGVGQNLLVVRTRGGPCCVLVFVVQVLEMQVVQQRPNCLRGCRSSGVLGIVLCVDWTSVAAGSADPCAGEPLDVSIAEHKFRMVSGLANVV